MIKFRSFTLVELVVVIAIIGILATVITPIFTEAILKAKIAKLVRVVKTLEDACDAFYADTGFYAKEYSGGKERKWHSLFYNVSFRGEILNWKGPYIKQPLKNADDPFGYIYVDTIAIGQTGFDLDGDGVEDISKGNYAYFGSVDEKIAWKIDQIYDAGVRGNWNETGKVKFFEENGGRMMIYLIGE